MKDAVPFLTSILVFSRDCDCRFMNTFYFKLLSGAASVLPFLLVESKLGLLYLLLIPWFFGWDEPWNWKKFFGMLIFDKFAISYIKSLSFEMSRVYSSWSHEFSEGFPLPRKYITTKINLLHNTTANICTWCHEPERHKPLTAPEIFSANLHV